MDDSSGHDDAAAKAEALSVAEAAQKLADRALAVEEAVRAGVVRDSRNTRRTNRILVAMVAIILLSTVWSGYRSTFVLGPAITDTEAEVTGPLSDANAKLDDLVDFVEIVEQGQTPEDQRVGKDDLTPVFDAIFETQAALHAAICQSTDPGLIELCTSLPKLPTP